MGTAAHEVGTLLATGTEHLAAAFGPEHPARLEAEILLAHVVDCERTELHTHPERTLDTEHHARFQRLLDQRRAGHPIAHIIGEWEFYGLPLRVTAVVLVPRPETELLVDIALERLQGVTRILDIGTGSGCVAVAIAHETKGRGIEIVATDLSPDALEVARENAVRHDASIEFVETDLVAGVTGPFDIIVSNPPYVALDDPALEPAVARFEPAMALRDIHDGDGLGFYRRLAQDAVPLLSEGGCIALEVGETQAADVAKLFQARNLQTETRNDLAGIPRVVIASAPPR